MNQILSSPEPIAPIEGRPSSYLVQGELRGARMEWFRRGLEEQLLRNGHPLSIGDESPGLVLNFADARRPRPYRRKAQGTFVVTIVEVDEPQGSLLRAAYPVLIRSLSNFLVYITRGEGEPQTHMVTLEQGYYTIEAPPSNSEEYFAEVYRRIAPLASSRLVINNIFQPDLPHELWNGDDRTRELYQAGRWLEEMDLLPAAFPIGELLSEREMHHVKRLFGIGGLSYGNLSVRCSPGSFWMSARGVDKGNLREIGRDVLLITGYEPDENAMLVSVPDGVEPRPASVDAVEHWLLYSEHPGIGAIIHIHAWMEGITSTSVNYPCGTYQLAQEVADLVRAEPDPTSAVIGLRNHGLTITGRSLGDIIERIDGRILRQVPMI